MDANKQIAAPVFTGAAIAVRKVSGKFHIERHKYLKFLHFMAEGGRFELPVACATTDFESVTFGRSDTPP